MKTSRVNEIDLLRFFGALSVVLYHYGFKGYAAYVSSTIVDRDNITIMPYSLLAPVAKYGYLGVDLFFLISGFVILMSADGRTFRSFFVSRVTRLYPAFWACCTITYVMIVAIGDKLYSASLPQYLVNMTLLSEFLNVKNIDGVYWSLFVEIRFYALIAAILLIKKIHHIQSFMILWLITSIVLVALGMETGAAGFVGDLLIIKYSAFVIAGATFFLILSRGVSVTRIAVVMASWGLALYQSLASLDKVREDYNTEMNAYVVAAIVTGLFLLMFLVSIRRTGWIARRQWLTLGALTYPLYLLHANVGFMIFNRLYPSVNPHLLLWGTVVLMIGAAYVIHRIVEKRLSSPLKAAFNYPFDALQRLKTRFFGRPRAS